MSNPPVTLASATPEDADAIHAMIVELAESEGVRGDLRCSVEDVRKAISGPEPRLHGVVASAEHEPIGVVTLTIDYAVWTGGEVLRVDDVFVREKFRRMGVGRRLMQEIAYIGLRRGMPCRWEIEVANTAAQQFYRALGVDVREKMVARWSLSAMRAQTGPDQSRDRT